MNQSKEIKSLKRKITELEKESSKLKKQHSKLLTYCVCKIEQDNYNSINSNMVECSNAYCPKQ